MNEIIDNKRKSEILVEALESLHYGDVILHKDISKLIGESYPSQRYNACLSKTKKLLLNKTGKVLESIRGDGYRVVEPDNYVDHSLRHIRRGFNEFQKGSDTLKHAPIKDMTEEGRESYRRVNDRMTILHASLKGAVVELKTLGEKNHPFLPENVNRK